MTDAVNPRRRYNSSRRLQQAADTREAVIAAARRLFTTTGWNATTIAGIALEARVSGETIYSIFGSKQSLLAAVIEATIRRERPASPLLSQPGPLAVLQAQTHDEQLDLFAKDIADVLADVAPLIAVVRTAAETDPELVSVYQSLHEGRRRNLAAVGAALLERGPLRHKMGVAEATSTIWRLASPELFLLLTRVEGIDVDAYVAWLAGALKDALIPGGGH